MRKTSFDYLCDALVGYYGQGMQHYVLCAKSGDDYNLAQAMADWLPIKTFCIDGVDAEPPSPDLLECQVALATQHFSDRIQYYEAKEALVALGFTKFLREIFTHNDSAPRGNDFGLSVISQQGYRPAA